MSTEVLSAKIAEYDKEIEQMTARLPFLDRMKRKYWGAQMKTIVAFGALKLAVVIAVVKGKVIASFVSTQFPMIAAALVKAWAMAVVFALGVMALVTGS